MEQLQPVITYNAQADERFSDAQSIAFHNLRSILCIPLMIHDEVLGVIYADNRLTEGRFRKSFLTLITAFANQVAIAIENARLFAQVEADLEQAQSEVRELRI